MMPVVLCSLRFYAYEENAMYRNINILSLCILKIKLKQRKDITLHITL